MNTNIIRITKDNLEKVLALNLSDIKIWKHYESHKGFTNETDWTNLSIFERWMHGGPWLDPETLEIHYELINSNGIILGLINDKNDIIGEADFIFQNNFFTKKSYCYLLWFLIHPDYRKQGLGSKFLMESIEKINRDFPKITTFETIPEDEISSKLYKKLGFKKINTVYNVTVDISDFHTNREIASKISSLPYNHSYIEKLYCWSRVFYPSLYNWNWLEKNKKFHQLINSPAYPETILKKIFLGEEEIYFAYNNRLYFWISYEKRFDISFLISVFESLIQIMKNEHPERNTFLMDIWYGEFQVLTEIGLKIKNISTNEYLRL